MTEQPTALRLSEVLDDSSLPVHHKAATELRRLYWGELRVREHRDMLAAEVTRLNVEIAKLQAENRRLREWHATAWNRGHAVGLNGLNTALRQMEEHRKSDAWGNTQLTEALLLAEEQRDELLAALNRIVGYDLPDEAAIIEVARAAIAKAEEKNHAALEQEEQAEPVAKVELMMTGGNAGLATRIVEIDDHLRERLRPGQLLYTAPPQRKPLTEEEIRDLWSWSMTAEAERTATTQQHAFARAVERAHNITDPQIADHLARHGIPMPGDPK